MPRHRHAPVAGALNHTRFVMAFDRQGNLLSLLLAALAAVLFAASLMTGPAHFGAETVAKALVSDQGVASIIVRDVRLPRTLLATLIGATFGIAGASLQGLLRNPLAEPSQIGAPQAAAASAAGLMAFGLVSPVSLAVPLGGIVGALLSVGALVAIAGRRASLTMTLLAGLALASLAGAALLLAADSIVRLVPRPLEIKIGVITALIGVPFFIAMIFRERQVLEESACNPTPRRACAPKASPSAVA